LILYPALSWEKIIEHIICGGFPEAVKISSPRLRNFWFASYISTYIERDVRDIGEIRNISNFIKIVNILAARSANILKIKELSNSSGINEVTTSNYITLLELVFFATCYTGILCHLLGISTKEQFNSSAYKGELVETFVLSELLKYVGVAENRASIYHYRTSDQKEIDFIIEFPGGLVAVEVKASRRIERRAFKHILDLQKKTDRFRRGIVFYLGDDILSFGKDLYALPLSCMA